MENEMQHHYTLRSGSRSRSQTPSIQTKALLQPEPERHYDLRSHSRERSGTPAEMSGSRKSNSRPSSAIKALDQSMETITQKREENVQEIENNQSGKSEILIAREPASSVKKPERRSERQKAKRQIFANGQSDTKGDSSSAKEDRKRTSVSPRRILTSDYSSEEGERDDPPSRPGSAYEIYKRAGEWWNVFPKTDYTYSERSQCRYEIAPGVLAMPNMSRRSIHSDGNSTLSSVPSTSQQNISQFSEIHPESGFGDSEDVTDIKEKKITQSRTPVDDGYSSLFDCKSRRRESGTRSIMNTTTHVEQYTSHREVLYAEPGNFVDVRQRHFSQLGSPLGSTESHKYTFMSQVDSDTELDDAVTVSTKISGQKWRVVQWFSSITTVLYLWFSSALESIKLRTFGRREYRHTYAYQRYQESKWSKLWGYVNHFSQYIYLFFVKIFLFNSWLLSRLSGGRKWLPDRASKLICIALLPLLLWIELSDGRRIEGGLHDWSKKVGYRKIPYHMGRDPYRCHRNGCSCLMYLPTTFTHRQVEVAEQTDRLFPFNKRSIFADNKDLNKDELTAIIRQLTERIVKLESGTSEQIERLLNAGRKLEQSEKSDALNKYSDRIMLLEQRLNEEKPATANSYEIEALKLEFITLKELYSQLKSYCDGCVNYMTNENINRRLEEIVSGYFGAESSKTDLSKIIKNLILTNTENKISTGESGGVSVATEDRVREIVKEALKIYDADKTGRVDYALESAGGQIISTGCTQRYDIKTRAIKLFAFTFYHENNNPRSVIQGNPIQPGACWAFQGFPGYLLIKLRSCIHVTGFTMEHAAKSILPNGEMKSAPRKFNVWGFANENDPEPVLFGDYEFQASDENLQYFPVQNTTITTSYQYIELRVHSNHGQLEYTCLYRFRVHGTPA